MNSERTAREVEQAQQIAALNQRITRLLNLLAAIVKAWRKPDTGNMVTLIKMAEDETKSA